MADESLSGNGDMVASYGVEITGIARTRKELAKLDGVIKSLRAGSYAPGASVTVAAGVGSTDIFVAKMDELEGRVQTGAQNAMLTSMDLGKRTQAESLRAATTKTGASGRSHVGGRKGPGREDSGSMIQQLARNVEVFKSTAATLITGWHGWRTDRTGHIAYQERGTKGRGARNDHGPDANAGVGRGKNKGKQRLAGDKKSLHLGVPAANSLGLSIPTVRENLKREIAKLKR